MGRGRALSAQRSRGPRTEGGSGNVRGILRGAGRKKAINVKTRSGKPTAPPSACPAWVGLVQLAHWQTGASLSNLCPLSTHQTKI